MSEALGIGAVRGPHGVRILIVRGDGSQVGYIDYTDEHAAYLVSGILSALTQTKEAGR